MEIINDLKIQIASYYDNIIAIIPKLALAFIIVFTLLSILRYVRKRSVKYMLEKADDRLLVGFIDSIFRIINVIIGLLLFLYIIGQSGIASSVLGAATISSVVIGFAFKDIAENFLAGVIMAFNRPFRIGDTVLTGSVEGTITEMSLRDTHIKTFDGKDVFVPNGQIIKNPLYNYTIDGFLRKSFSIGLDYGTDIDKARKIIITSISNVPGILLDEKPPKTLISELGASTINITVQYWLDTFDKNHSGTEIQSQAMKNALNALEAAGINLPGDIIEIKNYKNTPLQTNTEGLKKVKV